MDSSHFSCLSVRQGMWPNIPPESGGKWKTNWGPSTETASRDSQALLGRLNLNYFLALFIQNPHQESRHYPGNVQIIGQKTQFWSFWFVPHDEDLHCGRQKWNALSRVQVLLNLESHSLHNVFKLVWWGFLLYGTRIFALGGCNKRHSHGSSSRNHPLPTQNWLQM